MNIGEGYRWNIPLVTYGFDQTFTDFFGPNGVAAVESAVQILNDLPPASRLNLTNYSLGATRNNPLAQQVGLIDLKSYALAALLEQLGLASPNRYVFTPGPLVDSSNVTNFAVINRNFDPVSLAPSDTIDGIQFVSLTRVFHFGLGSAAMGGLTIIPTGPNNNCPSIASYLSPPVNRYYNFTGDFFLRLARDDVGGIGYLYGTNNVQWESLISGIRAVNAGDSALVGAAFRPGVDKVTFQRIDFDSTVGQTIPPVTNAFTDFYWADGALHQQNVERIVSRPDILFTATNCSPYRISRTGTERWTNNGAAQGHDGPGVIQPPITLNFNPFALHGAAYDRYSNLLPFEIWGSFDGTATNFWTYAAATNLPVNMTVSVTTIEEVLDSTGAQPTFSWTLPRSTTGMWQIQGSSDMTTWTTLAIVPDKGGVIDLWLYGSTVAPGFFVRVVEE